MQKENRNNRVHTGEQSGKTDFLIERLLPVGKENAITTQDLVKLSGCGSARELQQRIAYEREQGAIICSGSGRGYWRPKDRQEIQEFVHTMNARALNTLKAVKSAKRALKVPEGQQSMNGGNEPLLMPDISECITGMIKYRKKCGRLMFTRLELRPRMYFL